LLQTIVSGTPVKLLDTLTLTGLCMGIARYPAAGCAAPWTNRRVPTAHKHLRDDGRDTDLLAVSKTMTAFFAPPSDRVI
jgi:hypothetical protein